MASKRITREDSSKALEKVFLITYSHTWNMRCSFLTNNFVLFMFFNTSKFADS